jgi:hypothetical protein
MKFDAGSTLRTQITVVLITTTPYFANINSRFHESTPVLPKDDQTYSILPTL